MKSKTGYKISPQGSLKFLRNSIKFDVEALQSETAKRGEIVA